MSTENESGYLAENVPIHARTLLEAGAFRSLCAHLRERSDEVQNIDLMTLSGFCRNCLAKWLVLEARTLSTKLRSDDDDGLLGDASTEEKIRVAKILDALDYDDAAREVYGCAYPEWKKRHAKKATDEQMKKYEKSSPLHARHDKSLLKPRDDEPDPSSVVTSSAPNAKPPEVSAPPPPASSFSSSSLASNVCCQNADDVSSAPTNSSAYALPSPPAGGVRLRVGVLTVSDRASRGGYETGDLSGPAVERAVDRAVAALRARSTATIAHEVARRAVVPDEADGIARTLSRWSAKATNDDDDASCDLILTTGGTGFAPRDATPEATASVLDRECRGLMSWCATELAAAGATPLAPLSRGTAGVRGASMVVNLPGSPDGAAEVVEFLFPLLVRAVADLQQ